MRSKTIEPTETPWFKWVPAEATDVAATWRAHGWVPPSEDPRYVAKWAEWKRKLAGLDETAEATTEAPVRSVNVTPIQTTRARAAR